VPVWFLPNALVVRILSKYGYKAEARDIAARVVKTLLNSMSNYNTLFENYDADTGKGLWAPQFMSWNILALELIETLE
jgi:putative isomerase